MYLPTHFAVEDRAEILEAVRSSPFGHLVTSDKRGRQGELFSTPLPFVVDDELKTVRAHFSRANPHWRQADGLHALLIVPIADAYVSPRWYPSKAEHGKVVPTWNYEVVQLRGTLTIHDDEAWKLALVEDLTNQNELRASESGDSTGSWKVSDAPDDFIGGQLKGIVGVQLNVSDFEGKQKLSQNKQVGDREGAAAGLARSGRAGDREVAQRMS